MTTSIGAGLLETLGQAQQRMFTEQKKVRWWYVVGVFPAKGTWGSWVGPLYLTDSQIYKQVVDQKAKTPGLELYRLVYSPLQRVWIWDLRSENQLSLSLVPIPGYDQDSPFISGVTDQKPSGSKSITSVERARSARDSLIKRYRKHPFLRGVGIGKDAHGLHVIFNVRLLSDRFNPPIPRCENGVRVIVRQVGNLRAIQSASVGAIPTGTAPGLWPLVGVIPIAPTLRGMWPVVGFPTKLSILGTHYVRAEWKFPRKGVIAQYREAVPTNSKHLFVLEDGTFVVPHLDEENPDLGSPAKHFLLDVMKRPDPLSPLETSLRAKAPPIP